MAYLAAEPSADHGGREPNRRRPGRLAGALLAAVAGIAVLGVGFVRTAGGLAGSAGDGATAGAPAASGGCSAPSAAVASGGCGAPSRPSPAGPSSSGSTSSLAPTALPSGLGPSSGPPTATAAPAVLADRLQATVDRLRAKLAMPGVSATILFQDGTSWSGTSGFAAIASRTQVRPDTAFAFASVSKTFTSALILQLVGQGRLGLTDSAASRLPPLRIAIDPRITLAMLLNHTSGLADYFLNPRIDGQLQSRPSASWSVDRTLRYVGKSLSPPGVAWHYANTNYLLLGLIAERATGQRLADAIRSRLLEPTGLDGTWYQVGEAARRPLAHGYRLIGTKLTAKPIDLDDGSGVAPFRSVVTAAAGAGSLAGTSADLARWARALYSGKVLGAQGTAMLLSGFSKTTNYLPGVTYGYGVQALSIDGHPSLGHSGRLLGFRSAVRHFPLDGLTIAVLTNQSRADPGIIVQALLAVVLPPALSPDLPAPQAGRKGMLPS